MPKTIDSKEAIRIDSKEAARTDAIYDVRRMPMPPGDLWPDDESLSDEERFDFVASRHWNAAVALLDDGAGYANLVQLLARLEHHLAEHDDEERRASAERRLYRYVGQIIESESERLGATAQVGEVLEPSRAPDHDLWRWEPRLSWAQTQSGPMPGTKPERVALRSSVVDDLVAQGDRIDHMVEFDRDATWQELLDDHDAMRFVYELGPNAAERKAERVRRLVEFRRQIVSQVLREVEILGHVGYYDPGALGPTSHGHVDLDDDQQTFLDAALASLQEMREEIERHGAVQSGRLSWANVRKRIEDKTGWDTKTVEGIAEEKFVLNGRPAFVKGVGRGSGPFERKDEQGRFLQFVELMSLHRRATRGG